MVLECLARFLYEETNLHVALVPLLPVCRALAAWHTALQDWLDNTVRAVAQYQLVRTGRRARRMPRRGHPEAIDMEFLAERGFLPEEVLNTMQLRGTTWQAARTERSYRTLTGYVHVEEVEAAITYAGGHHAYWCLSATSHYTGDLPTDSETFSDYSDGESELLSSKIVGLIVLIHPIPRS